MGALAGYMRPALAVLAKDALLELRTKDIIVSVPVFALLVIVIFNFALDPTPSTVAMIGPGILWVSYTFGAVLGLNRSFAIESDRGNVHGLMLAPVGRDAIYFGKLASNLLYLFLLEICVLPMLLVMFDTNLYHPVILLGLFLGTLGYAEVGTFFAALTANTRARESMLPVLLLPVMVPVFMAGVSLTAGILDGRPISGLVSWLVILAVFDVIFFIAAYWIVDLIWDGI